jgi:hypothetical protein
MKHDDVFAINVNKMYSNLTDFMYVTRMESKDFTYACKLLKALINEDIKKICQAISAGYHRPLLGDRYDITFKEIIILNDYGEALTSLKL